MIKVSLVIGSKKFSLEHTRDTRNYHVYENPKGASYMARVYVPVGSAPIFGGDEDGNSGIDGSALDDFNLEDN